MAIEAARVVIPVDSNAKATTREFRQLDTQLDRTGKATAGVTKAFNALKAVGIVALAVQAARAIGRFAAESVEAASVAEETRNKFAVTFQGIRAEAEETAASLATNYGLARSEAESLLANTGDLLTGFGFAREEALSLSTQVQTLAVDLASFTNYSGGAVGASEALTKALLGERESVKALGISIMEADIQQLAEDKGIVGELSRQQKAMLTLELAIRQSGNAIGDFERSIASYANQQRIARANTLETKEAIGNALLPFANLAVTTYNNLAGGIKETAGQLKDFVTSVEGATRIASVIAPISGAVAILIEYFRAFFNAWRDVGQNVFQTIREAFATFSNSGERSITVMDLLGGALQVVVAGVAIFGKVLEATITNISNFIEAVRASARAVGTAFRIFSREVTFEDVKNEFQAAGRAFAEFGRGAVTGVRDIVAEVVDQVGSFTSGAEERARQLEEVFAEVSQRTADTVVSALTAATDAAIDSAEEARIRAEEEQRILQQAAEEAQRERERLAAEAAETAAAIEQEYSDMVFEQSASRIAILERERDRRIAEAEAVGASTVDIETYYANEIAAIRREAAEEEAERLIEEYEERRRAQEEFARERFEAETQRLEELKALRDEARAAEEAAQEEARQEQLEAERAVLEAMKAIYNEWRGFMDDVSSYRISLIDDQIAALKEQQTEEEENADQIAALEKRKAALERQAALFRVAVNTAAGIARALSDYPFPYSLIVGGLVLGAGVAQTAEILSEPLPGAQHGGMFEVPPGLGGDGGLLKVSSGEQVSVAPARAAPAASALDTVAVRIGEHEFRGVVEDVFNRGGGQIRRSSAIRTRR